MNRRGFTIVELLIIIAVMGTLLVLGVVNLRGSQAHARDTERKTDVETIAHHLEVFYTSGRDGSTSLGRYPSTGLTASGVSSITMNLRDINLDSVQAPGVTDPLQTFLMASNSDQTISGILPLPSIDEYVYQPLQSNGDLCTTGAQECRKFNIFYRTEVDNTVRMITSKNQ